MDAGKKPPRPSRQDARRIQNRIASQMYRQRRRQRLALLDEMLNISPSNESAVPGPFENTAGSMPRGPSTDLRTTGDGGMEGLSSDLLPQTHLTSEHRGLAIGETQVTRFVSTHAHHGASTAPNIFSAVHPPSEWNTVTPLGHESTFASQGQVDNPQLTNVDPRWLQQSSFSQILANISALDVHEKHELMGILASEMGVDTRQVPLLGHTDAVLSTAMDPHAFLGGPDYSQSSSSSESLKISMEVTRYERWLRHRTFAHPHLPDPLADNLRIHHKSFYGAILANSAAIGLTNQEVLREDGLSPYNIDEETGHQAQELAEARTKFSVQTPRDLRPTDLQLMKPHHPYLDVIPFASFRQRALAALVSVPPLFDEEEMCRDMDGEGFVCWGGGGDDGGGRGMAAEVPWDAKSWEPKVWFLRKYWFLVGGWDEEMWKNARWWAMMRNERISM